MDGWMERKSVFAEEAQTISAAQWKSAGYSYVSKNFYATLNVKPK
jgi:hypothetical protein